MMPRRDTLSRLWPIIDNDRAFDHALTYALIEVDNRQYLKNSLNSGSPRVVRACLTALDQLGDKLDPKVVLTAMKSKDAALKETAEWIAGRHPEWAPQLLEVFAERLADAKGDDLAPQLAKFAKTPTIQEFLARSASNSKASDRSRMVAMKAMAVAGLKTPPEAWYTAIENTLTNKASKEVQLASVTTLRALPPPKKGAESLTRKLLALVKDTTAQDVVLGSRGDSPWPVESRTATVRNVARVR